MMISPRRRRRASLPLFFWTALFLAAAGAVVLWRGAFGGMFWALAAPVMRLQSDFHQTEVVRLRAELASSSAALADRDVLYAQNLDLKRRLGRNAERQVILAALLQRPSGTPYDTLLVDAGFRDGLVQGQLVAAAGEALIGRVDEVYASSARVTLFSSPGQTFTALLRGSIPVQLEGQGGGSLKGQVPAGTGAKAGDPLLIMGVGTGLLGEVSATDIKEGQSFETLYMRLSANPQELAFVEIWK